MSTSDPTELVAETSKFLNFPLANSISEIFKTPVYVYGNTSDYIKSCCLIIVTFQMRRIWWPRRRKHSLFLIYMV